MYVLCPLLLNLLGYAILKQIIKMWGVTGNVFLSSKEVWLRAMALNMKTLE